jgi:hypothetical protein
VRVSGRANRRRAGQVSGSQIPYALPAALAVGALVIAVVGASLGALAMPALGLRHDDLARRLAARAGAVLLAVVAGAANRLKRPAIRASEQSLVEHALVGRRLLAFLLASGEGAPVDAPSRDTEGWELPSPGLRPFRRATPPS